jgi:hypothetical protein
MDTQITRYPPTLSRERVDRTLGRIDAVLQSNRRELWTYITFVALLFGAGITCLVAAIVDGRYGWSIPPVITTALLHWPLRAIRDIRRKNIALAIAPALIELLPADEAVAEIRRLLRTL